MDTIIIKQPLKQLVNVKASAKRVAVKQNF